MLVACDVTNPLCGEHGASRVYGPQKGATPEMVEELDTALRRFGEIVERALGVPVLDVPGSGAAGGLGAGLLAFTGGTLRSGVELVAEACALKERVARADAVITGEGRLDGQTAHGKTVAGVARIAQQARPGIPVIALAGQLGSGFAAVYECGVSAALSVCPRPMPVEEAIAGAREHLRDAAEAVTRMLCAAGLDP
jgi:glycerate kinase